MPQFLEDKLKTAARAKGFKGRKAAAYVYGTLNNIGAMHGNEVTPKGEAIQRKHDDAKRAKLQGMSSMRTV